MNTQVFKNVLAARSSETPVTIYQCKRSYHLAGLQFSVDIRSGLTIPTNRFLAPMLTLIFTTAVFIHNIYISFTCGLFADTVIDCSCTSSYGTVVSEY